MWLSWKHEVTWERYVICDMLLDKFWKKSLRLVAFALILKKVINVQSRRGQNPPPPPTPPV